uniref:R3H-associated N-terminal domain-containing protein n=1 Tax=Knipowitschia caucasica TaxID=637954 RepID=A0AAV2KTM3_KNICA
MELKLTASANRVETGRTRLPPERQTQSLPCSPLRRVSPKKKQFYINQAVRNSELIQRAKGKKSQRRQENSRFLANLLEKEECCDELEVGSVPALPTVFTEACVNGNYVEPWSDFLSCSGEEQEVLLELLEQEEARRRSRGGGGGEALRDQRNVIFSPHHCFQRIDRRLRATLRKRQVPIGTVEVLEENLLSFFNTDPTSVFITCLSSSFERLLLHAVCQYMDLVSLSTDSKGSRQTEVVNKHNSFLPPSLLLSAYLQRS